MKKIDIFCGINSFGMPFPKENKNHIGYYDIIKSKLSEEGYETSGVNISRLDHNHTWDLEKNLNQNYSLAQIKNIQINSIEALRNTNILFKLIIPKKYKDNFIPTEKDKSITLKNLFINSENPIFLYSGGPNDFFTYIKAGPVELMDKAIRKNLPANLEQLIKKCVDNVEKNWLLLYKLNSNVIIFSLGYYYSPLYDKIQKVIFLQEKLLGINKKYINRFSEIINLYNSLLEERSKKYDFVSYVDIGFIKDHCAPVDFHPNTKGNELIADAILKKSSFYNELESKKTGISL